MEKRAKKINDIILCVLLLTFSLALMFILIFSNDKTFSEKENRALKTKPNITIEKVLNGKYFVEITKYCTDQFPFRESFTGISSFIDLSLCRNESNGVIVSKDEILIPRHDYENHQILIENLNAISRFIENNNEKNLPSYIAVAPRSIDVNKKALPSYFSTSYGTSEYQELYKTIQESKLIDTLPHLSNATDSGIKTFYNTDHHWTTHGAYIAYLEIAKKLGVEPYPLNYFDIETISTDFLGTSFSKSGLFDFESKDTILLYRYENDSKITVTNNNKSKELYDFSALDTSDKYSVFLGGNTDVLKIRNQKTKPKLLLIKDSFANSVIPFLALHFDIDAIDLRYYKNSLSDYITTNDFDATLILFGIDTLATEISCLNIKK